MTGSKIGVRIARALVLLTALTPLPLAVLGVSAAAGKTSGGGASQPPSAATGTARAHGTGVELEGAVTPGGQEVTYFFEYGPSKGTYVAVSASGKLKAGTERVKVSETVSPFPVKEHYRLVATNALGTKRGKDKEYVVKSTRPKVTLEKPPLGSQDLVGEPLTLNGALTGVGNGNHPVMLQARPYPYTGAFTAVGAVENSNLAGRFSFHIASLTGSTEYRVLTVGGRTTESPVVTILAALHVTLHVRTSSHRGLVRLYGTVSPAVPGARVLFQLEEKPSETRKPPKSERAEEKAELPKYASKFVTTSKRATKTFSRFSSIVTIQVGGRYRALVVPPRGPLSSGYSSGIVLRAAPSKKKKKTTKK